MLKWPPTVLALAVLCAACGGGGSSTPSPTPSAPVSISISPTTASVQTGNTQQFTAAIQNTSNTAVTWEVNGAAGGNSSSGTISSSGIYKGPAAVPNPATVTVTAVSKADSTKSASAVVTITPPPPVSVSITSPQSGTSVFGNVTIQTTVSLSVTGVQFQVDGNNVGPLLASAPFSYTFDTLPLPNGAHSLTAVANDMGGDAVTSNAVSINIENQYGQWRFMVCPISGGSAFPENYDIEANLQQSDYMLTSDVNNTLVASGPYLQGCPTYISPIQGMTGTPNTGTIQGGVGTDSSVVGGIALSLTITSAGAFQTPPSNSINVAVCHISGDTCTGPATGPYSGDQRIITGQRLSPISGSYTGTITYSSTSYNITATLQQGPDYTVSGSYTGTPSPGTLSGKMIGGIFETSQGFDGNPMNGVYTPNNGGGLEIYDANWLYLGTLQKQ